MTRVCLLACLALVGFLLQRDLAVAGYQAPTSTRVAQADNSAKPQAPDTPDTSSGDDSNGPADDSKSPPQDQE